MARAPDDEEDGKEKVQGSANEEFFKQLDKKTRRSVRGNRCSIRLHNRDYLDDEALQTSTKTDSNILPPTSATQGLAHL